MEITNQAGLYSGYVVCQIELSVRIAFGNYILSHYIPGAENNLNLWVTFDKYAAQKYTLRNSWSKLNIQCNSLNAKSLVHKRSCEKHPPCGCRRCQPQTASSCCPPPSGIFGSVQVGEFTQLLLSDLIIVVLWDIHIHIQHIHTHTLRICKSVEHTPSSMQSLTCIYTHAKIP